MITREQIYTMLLLRSREDSPFYQIPEVLIEEISNHGKAPDSDIAIALHYVAYARQEDVTALLTMLDENPRLLLQSGNVKGPGGDEIQRVTIYEYALGAGDDELAKLIQPYFAKIENGDRERIHQYERYSPHIQGIRTQTPYNLSPLIELIKKASHDEVTALLNNDLSGDTDLCKAMQQFRTDWGPKILIKPGMHYNYASLYHALNIFGREFSNLYDASGRNLNKINLVWRQLIGFELRRLPGIDRCAIAQGVYSIIVNKKPCSRTYTFTDNIGGVDSFPITDSDESVTGPGADFAIDIEYGGSQDCGQWEAAWGGVKTGGLGHFGKFMSKKIRNLTALMPPQSTHQRRHCVIS